MHRMWSPLLTFLTLTLCACEPVEPPDWCDGATQYAYAPERGGSVDVLPDDFWTLPADTPTGLRVHLEVDQTPGLPDTYEETGYLAVFDHLSELDGWGLTAGITLRFSRPVDPDQFGPEDVALVTLPVEGAPVRIAADVQLTDYDTTAILLPRTPLPPATLVAAAVLETARGSDGKCIAPSVHLRELLSPETELDDGVPADVRSPDYIAAAAALNRPVEQISAMVTFTTQSATRLSRLVAEDILDRPTPTVPEPLTCTWSEAEGWTLCDGRLTVLDYRRPDHTMDPDSDGDPVGEHDLPLTVWLPGDGTGGPFPVVFYGHGLAHDRTQGGRVARLVVPDGYAVLAVDAVEHGDHPSRTDVGIDFLEQLTFFGIEFTPPSVDGRLIRDNWRQSTFDKLQVIEALRAGLDADGDGTVDLDDDRMVYAGLSLGGIMGPELLALSDAFDGSLLSVPGGRTTGIIQDSDLFSPLIAVMAPEGSTPGDVDRYFPLLQTIVDPGDSMVWAPHVRTDRLDDADLPQVLVQIALNDQTVPNSTNEPVVRSLGAPGVGREVWPIADISFVPGPVDAAGFQQFDFVVEHEGEEPSVAGHDNITWSVEGWTAASAFINDVIDGEIATVSDPYAR